MAAVAFYVVSVLFISIVIAGYATAVRDVSWIVTVENLIKKENWRPNATFDGLEPSTYYLYEDGEEQFFKLNNTQELASCVFGLLDRVNRQVKYSMPEIEFNETLAADKLLGVGTRFPVKWQSPSSLWTIEYSSFYLVLEDKLGTGLEGTVIVTEHLHAEPWHRYNVYEISNWTLW